MNEYDILDDHIKEEINDQVIEAIYIDDDIPWFDTLFVKIIAEDDDFLPLEIEGECKKEPICTEHDDHCRYCHKKGCTENACVEWIARLRLDRVTDDTFIYEVNIRTGYIY